MSFQVPSKLHNADAFRLLADLQCLLDNSSPDTYSQAITDNWRTLQTTYYSWAEFLESCKKAIGGSWEKNKPDSAEKCEEKYIQITTLLTAATRDYSTHSRHTTTLGRQILALSGEHQQWERTFLLWQFELARADLDRMDKKCEKLKGRAAKWEKRGRREHEKIVDFYIRLEKEIGQFSEFYRKMEEAEERLKGFWARERWCKAESGLGREACAEKMRGLESWRCWPSGRLCGGVSVWDCVVDHEHE